MSNAFSHISNPKILAARTPEGLATVALAGAFRTVAGDALDVELFLMPVKETLDVALNSTLLRAVSSLIY